MSLKTNYWPLVYYILKNAGFNVGRETLEPYNVADESYDYYVLKLVVSQLDDIQNFRSLFHYSPFTDHLDQYNYSYEEYALQIQDCRKIQKREDFFIYNQDDEMTQNFLKNSTISQAKLLAFSLNKELQKGAFATEK